jgi:hypothetical protein
MNLTKYINIPVFIISLALGLFYVYVTMPDTRKIFVYPTHENINKIQFKDKTDTCFSFKEEAVECPSDPSMIEKVPIQH